MSDTKTAVKAAKTPKTPRAQRACQCMENDACPSLTYATFAMGHDARFVGFMRDLAVERAYVAERDDDHDSQTLSDVAIIARNRGASELLVSKITYSAKLAIKKARAKHEAKANKPEPKTRKARHLAAVPTPVEEVPQVSAVKAKVGRWVKSGRLTDSGVFVYLSATGQEMRTTKFTVVDEANA